MDLAEVEDIKKRCQEYREEVYKKKKKYRLNDLDNHEVW